MLQQGQEVLLLRLELELELEAVDASGSTVEADRWGYLHHL